MANTQIILGKLQTTTFQITSGATNGYVLLSDSSGNASWSLPYSFTGGTVNGQTTFTNGLSANTITATTYYGGNVRLTGSIFVNSSIGSIQWGDNGFAGSITGFLSSNSNGVFRFGDSSGGGSPRIILGSAGSTTGVAIKRNDTTLQVRLGDDSGFASLESSSLTSTTINTTSIRITSGATSGYILTSDSVGNGIWTAISSAVPQTDVIYVDSILGVDDNTSNRGNIEKPYATVEYVLSAVTNTGTITGNTTNGSNTISGVSSTTDIKVGQYITGNGIPFNTTVLSKTSNSITISTTATANGTVTLTWWTPKLLRLNGDFTATSNWFKQGFYFDSNPSVSVQWGAFNLYDVTGLAVIPYINNSEFNYYGTTSSSRWFVSTSNVQTSDTTISFKFTSVHSNTTNYLLSVGGSSNYYYGNYRFEGKILNAKLGYACSIGWSQQNVYFDIQYTYGLLGGVSYDYFQNSGIWKGSITTPASVYAINNGSPGNGNIIFSDGVITGSVYYSGKGGVTRMPFYSNIVGSTTCNLSGMVMYGNIPDNAILNGNVDLYGYHTSYLYCDAGYNRIYRVPLWGIVSRNSAVVEVNSDMAPYNLQAQGTSKIIVNAKVTPGSVSIAAGSKIIVNGELNTTAISVSGELINNNDTILTSGSITINSGGKVRNYKKIESTVASTTVPLIVKDAGDLYLYPGSYLKVANAKGPLKCTTNTSGSTNIYMFNSITNCDGSSYGLLIPFSAGTSYAANDLVGGLLYENINY